MQRFLPCGLGFLAACGTWAAPYSFDYANEFSLTNNPNGGWTYGYQTSDTGPLIPFSEAVNSDPHRIWRTNISLGTPAAWVSESGAWDTPANWGWLHPGPSGEIAVAQWMYPVGGTVLVELRFTEGDVGVVTPEFWIDNTKVWDAPNTSTPATFVGAMPYSAGQALRAKVKAGTDFFYDSTGVSFRILYGSEYSLYGQFQTTGGVPVRHENFATVIAYTPGTNNMLWAEVGIPVAHLGAFLASTTPTGTVDLRIRLQNSLFKRINNVTFPVSLATPILVPAKLGDIIGDNEIGAADFSVMAYAYDSVPGDTNWVYQADLNADNEVGAADFSILAVNYDEVGDE